MNVHFKKYAVLVLALALVLSLTGCDGLDYREAVRLYNAGKFDAAAEIFHELGDYEDSARLFTRSHYHAAVALLEQGKPQEALPRFLKLGEYEDAPQRVTECRYQLALAAFDAGDLKEAEHYFQDIPNTYRQTPEYLRRLAWQKLYDAISAAGFNNISGFIIEKELDGKQFSISANHHDHTTQELCLSVFSGTNGDFLYSDGLEIILTRDSTVAAFTCGSGFGMDFGDAQIGSSQSASGKLDITTCTPETPLVIETFEKTVTDNQGNTYTSADPADCLMDSAMAENLAELLQVVPGLLLEAGISLTLQDIGFYAL